MAIEVHKIKRMPDWAQRARGHRTMHYPQLLTLQIDELLRIPVDDQRNTNFGSFRAALSLTGKRLGRKFRCHLYDDGTIEVVRLT